MLTPTSHPTYSTSEVLHGIIVAGCATSATDSGTKILLPRELTAPGHVLEFDKARPRTARYPSAGTGSTLDSFCGRRREFGLGSPTGCRAVPGLLSAPPPRTRC